jgi:hypothetical protein
MKVQRQVACVTSFMLQNCSPWNLTQLLICVMLYTIVFFKLKEFVMIPVDGVGGNGAISPISLNKTEYMEICIR